MPKKKQSPAQYNVAALQPDEIGALRDLVKEFVGRVENIDNEIELLKEDRKSVIEEYAEKLDMKTLQAALRSSRFNRALTTRTHTTSSSRPSRIPLINEREV